MAGINLRQLAYSNDSIAPLSIFLMFLMAPINEIQLRHIYL
jgi:hypothetical protein